jgi:hypothetical protein
MLCGHVRAHPAVEAHHAQDRGVVDDEAAEPLFSNADDLGDVVLDQDVGADAERRATRIPDFLDDALQLLLPPRGEHDTRTLPSERLCRGLSDPRACARDQCNLSIQP